MAAPRSTAPQSTIDQTTVSQTTVDQATVDQTIAEEIVFPPGDLYSDEPQMETYLHLQQMILFLSCLEWLWRDRQDFFAAGNLTVYYSPYQKKSTDFRGPDFFVVLGTERKPRKSWVVWEEHGQYPNLIIEVLSDSTAQVDRTEKKTIYQDIFRTPEYFWFDPDSQEFAGFVLMNGKYQPIAPNDINHLWSEQLQLYLGVHDQQLRFFTIEGELVPTPAEAADLAEQKADRAKQEADRAKQEADRAKQERDELAARLRALEGQ